MDGVGKTCLRYGLFLIRVQCFFEVRFIPFLSSLLWVGVVVGGEY